MVPEDGSMSVSMLKTECWEFSFGLYVLTFILSYIESKLVMSYDNE